MFCFYFRHIACYQYWMLLFFVPRGVSLVGCRCIQNVIIKGDIVVISSVYCLLCFELSIGPLSLSVIILHSWEVFQSAWTRDLVHIFCSSAYSDPFRFRERQSVHQMLHEVIWTHFFIFVCFISYCNQQRDIYFYLTFDIFVQYNNIKMLD